MSISFIEGVTLSNLCDYSFGDQASIVCNIEGGWMKNANINNIEFVEKVNLISKSRNYMTLFIDNIRLYKRTLVLTNDNDRKWIDQLMINNDLLDLCGYFPNMNFIIFCNLEDTPIDEYIEGRIPENVLRIYASNAIYNSDKVIPLPYGVQRDMYIGDNKRELIKKYMYMNISPSNLLYVNHNELTNIKERHGIFDIFEGRGWSKVERNRVTPDNFYRDIKNHKFIVCPMGNAVDCHRNWEVLYLGRVPVMKRNEYLEKLFNDLPVLFVDDYSMITEKLLIDNDFLYQQSLSLDLSELDINNLYKKILKKEIK